MGAAMLTLVCLRPAVTAAQTASGPTMDETKAWLESEGRELMRTIHVKENEAHFVLSTNATEVERMSLNDCTLLWREVQVSQVCGPTAVGFTAGRPSTRTTEVFLILSEVNAGSVTVQSDTVSGEELVYSVRLAIRKPDEARSYSLDNRVNRGNPTPIRTARVLVQTREDGQRVVNAMRHAIAASDAGGAPGDGTLERA